MLAIALAALACAPTLLIGRFADDYLHEAILEHLVPIGGPLDLYSFAEGIPERTLEQMKRGPYPWWTLPDLKLHFFRPLSSALVVFDHAVLGERLALRHLHSVLWYLALVALYGALVKRVLPGTLGACALLVFAVDEAHVMPVAWLANRNALVSAVPALLGLLFHLLWREERRAWALPAALAGWSVGLLGGESALGVMAYAIAYELLAGPGGWRRRLISLVPIGSLLATYAVLYRHFGYGAWGSGTYLDPVGQTRLFLATAGGRFLALVAGALLNLPGELAMSNAPSRWGLWGVGALVLLVAIAVGRRLWPELAVDERRHARWLLAGSVASAVPVLATFPSNRLLLVPSLGSSVLLAILLVVGRRTGRRVLVAFLALLHLVLPLPQWMFLGWGAARVMRYGEVTATELPLDPARLPQQHVAILPVPDPLVGVYLGLMRQVMRLPIPIAWWSLTVAPHDHRLTRTAANAFELELLEGRFLRSEFEQLFRGPDHPLQVGEQVDLDGLRVEVVAGDSEGPRKLRYVFARSLDDPDLVLLEWRDGRLLRYAPPRVGGTEVLVFQPSLPFLR